ncbi:MAG TPA: DUF883 domain-containing protein, partial [Burkholderiaceae bacterium]|nr:DUF883 domain-containing protein [Burkholderiaceae bacterium]
REREEEFVQKVKESLDEAERMLQQAAEATGEKAEELRDSAMRSLRRTREHLYSTQDELMLRGRRAIRATDDYVHDNPWRAIGVAGLVGVLIGALICRR